MTNDAQLPMMKNMLNSALKAGFTMENFHCYILKNYENGIMYGTSEFQSITIRKLQVVLENMQLDKEVLWIDNDIVLFENMIQEMRKISGHFIMQDDIWSPCTGFFLVRSDPFSQKTIRKSIEFLTHNYSNTKLNDQFAFKEVYDNDILIRVTLLPRETYPNGKCYFDLKMTEHAKMVHNNYLTNTPEKVERFKKHGLWDDSDVGFNMVNKYYI